jgi:2-polyprenyl-3-methyl-5-hydroxy-6-metoxy-1,4-benzoquinol methylase
MATDSAAGVRRPDSEEDGYFEWDRPELRELVPETARRVLDVGCGAGALGGALRDERGIEVVGVELFADAAARAAERLDDVVVADLDTVAELPYPHGHFDAMVFGDVLEHLRDPHRLLRALRPYLADDGVIVCSIPNVKHWSVVAPLLVRDHWRYTDSGLLDRTHLHFFTLEEIGEMLAETGFAVDRLKQVVDPVPAELDCLSETAARLGADRTETAARLGVYQYMVVASPQEGIGEAPPPGPAPISEDAEAHAASTAAISLVVTLSADADAALRCVESIAALRPDQPDHEVVVVHDDAPALRPLLAQLDGDVTLVRAHGEDEALALGLARCQGDVVVLLDGMPRVTPGFLAPLVAALEDDGVSGAASGSTSPVAASALAFRRAASELPLPAAPAELTLPALCLQLARRGEVRAVPESIVVAGPATTSAAAATTGAASTMRRAPSDGEVELTIVIPTLDAAGERTRRCIRAAQANTTVDHEIVVVDNGAPPQGFTAPVNAGLRAARGRYLLVLNDDVELLPGWWEPLRDALDDGAAVVFPETVDGPMRHDFAAWCFALSRDTLERFAVADGEFLDPDLVVWYQDTDLLHRLRMAGTPPVHVPRSQIRHLLSATVNSDEPALRAWVGRQVVADKAAFEAKHGTGVAGAAS